MSAGYIIYSLDWDRFRQLVERPSKQQLTVLAELLRDALEEQDGEFEEGDPILEWPADVPALTRIVAERLALPDWYGDLSRAGKDLWEGVIFSACMDCKDIDVGFRVDSDGVYWDVIEAAWKHLGVVPDTITDVALSAFGKRPYRYHPRPRPATGRAEYDQAEAERHASLEALGQALGQFLEEVKGGHKDPDSLLGEMEALEGVSQEHKDLIRSFVSDDDDEDDENEADWYPMHSMHTPEEVEKMLAELKSIETAMLAAKKKDVRQEYRDDLMPAIESVARDGRMLFIQVDT